MLTACSRFTGEKAPRPSSAPVPDTPAPVAMPVTPTELNDEELARLLHEVSLRLDLTLALSALIAHGRSACASSPALPCSDLTLPYQNVWQCRGLSAHVSGSQECPARTLSPL